MRRSLRCNAACVASVIVARDGRSAASDEEVEVSAFVRLQHVVDVQFYVPAHAV
jgi:hypothetical protein